MFFMMLTIVKSTGQVFVACPSTWEFSHDDGDSDDGVFGEDHTGKVPVFVTSYQITHYQHDCPYRR